MGDICENRECRVCGETKPLSLFPGKPKNGVLYYLHKCKKCRAKRVNELIKASPEQLERKRALNREYSKIKIADGRGKEQCLKYRQSRKGILKYSELREASNAKLREVARIRMIGKFCPVYPVKCIVCDRLEIKRKRSVAGISDFKCSECLRKSSTSGVVVDRCCIKCSVGINGGVTVRMCDPCRKQARKESRYRSRTRPEHVNDRGKHKKRAAKYGCYYEYVDPRKVYERDKHRCVSCGCKVVMSKVYQPNQASLDHIIPMSMGGSHTYTNTQTMCVSCNSSKGSSLNHHTQPSLFDHV